MIAMIGSPCRSSTPNLATLLNSRQVLKNMPSTQPQPRKLDRRAIRTRRALRDALIALILEKGYEAVTVQDITDRADLNRGTLYLHYRDKQDLLLKSSADAHEELIAKFTPIAPNSLSLDHAERHLTLVFEHVAANADFYRVMLGDHGVAAFSKRLREVVAQVGLMRLDQLSRLRPVRAVPPELIAGYAGGAIIGVVEWWLQHNFPMSPAVAARETLHLIVRGVYPTLGLDDPGPEYAAHVHKAK